MTGSAKRSVLGVDIDAVTPADAVERVLDAARESRTFRVAPLAVHGVMDAHDDPVQLHRLNRFEMVVPDGQPVRWAMNLLHGSGLRERVYGPTLMLDVCERAAGEGLPIYLLGTTTEILSDLEPALMRRFPDLRIAGTTPSTFSTVDAETFVELCHQVRESGAKIAFVGLGCPRQEVFAFEAGPLLEMPVLAVGAAFEYHAGHRQEPPAWVQRWGLQWLHRLANDPRRLWKRYTTTNPRFVLAVARQRSTGRVAVPDRRDPPFVGWA